ARGETVRHVAAHLDHRYAVADAALARVVEDLASLPLLACADERQMDARNGGDGVRQLLPSLPVVHAGLRHEKTIVRNRLLMPETARVPFRRTEVPDVRFRMDH